MKMENQTNKTYFLVFQKLFSFSRFCGVADTRDEAIKVVNFYKKEYPQDKFRIVRIDPKKE